MCVGVEAVVSCCRCVECGAYYGDVVGGTKGGENYLQSNLCHTKMFIFLMYCLVTSIRSIYHMLFGIIGTLFFFSFHICFIDATMSS